MIEIKQRLHGFVARNEALCLWVVAVLLFTFGIWHQPFINFETRFAVFAQEMLRHGPTLFPTTYGQPYPDYPVTSTVLIWLASLPFGEVTRFSAVLPTALASALVVALTYRLLVPYSRRWGALAVGFELLTLMFVAESRSISIDQMVSAITLAAFYLTHQAYREQAALPTKRLWLLLIAGFLIRGPIGIVIPAGVVLSHLMLTSGRRDVLAFAASSAAILLACVLAMLGLSMLAYGREFVLDIIKMQATSRFGEAADLPRYYYFTSSFGNYALSYPIAVLVTLGLLFEKIRTGMLGQHAKVLILLLAWAGIVLLGLSVPQTKKIRYILPAIPPLAALASYALLNAKSPSMKWIRRCVELVLLLLPLLLAIFIYTQKAKFAASGLNLTLYLAIFLSIFGASVLISLFLRRNGSDRSLALCFVAGLSAYVFQVGVFEPINSQAHDTSGFVRRIEALRAERPGELVFYKENPDGLAIKYLVNAKMDFLPRFVSDLDSLKDHPAPVWLLTKAVNADELQRAGIATEPGQYRALFEGVPFVAVYRPAHRAAPTPANAQPK
ncbi:MAG: putative rane protein [Proteobacteria bacterium]|nr:putative rane protein [Pseudomonadota bacterium]